MNKLHKIEETLRSIFGFLRGQVRAPIAISLGAIGGALSRYYLSVGVNQWLGTSFPVATLIINLSGALIMGFFTHIAVSRTIISPELRLMIAVGFLGAYTTFSTYTLEIEQLITTGQWHFMAVYWMISTLLGLLSLELGSYLARKFL